MGSFIEYSLNRDSDSDFKAMVTFNDDVFVLSPFTVT